MDRGERNCAHLSGLLAKRPHGRFGRLPRESSQEHLRPLGRGAQWVGGLRCVSMRRQVISLVRVEDERTPPLALGISGRHCHHYSAVRSGGESGSVANANPGIGITGGIANTAIEQPKTEEVNANLTIKLFCRCTAGNGPGQRGLPLPLLWVPPTPSLPDHRLLSAARLRYHLPSAHRI